MQLLSALLFGVSASLDALLVGITYGIRRVPITPMHNLLISLITLAGTSLSIGLGEWLLPLLPAFISKLTGSLILVLLGLYYLLKYTASFFRNSTVSRTTEDSALLTFPKAAALGLALSLNNMGIGLSASIAGLPLLSASAVTFFFSLLFLSLGNHLGLCPVLRITARLTDPLSGLLLIFLGILEFFL